MLITKGELRYASDPLPRFQRQERAQDITGGVAWAFWFPRLGASRPRDAAVPRPHESGHETAHGKGTCAVSLFLAQELHLRGAVLGSGLAIRGKASNESFF